MSRRPSTTSLPTKSAGTSPRIYRSPGDNMVHQIFHGLRTDGAFLTGLFDAGEKFFARKFLVPAIALSTIKPFAFDFLVVVKRCAFGAFASRRIVAPSREARESMTLSSYSRTWDNAKSMLMW